MRYALIAWLFGGQMWIDGEPLTEAQCMDVVRDAVAASINGTVFYAADGLPPIERLACVPIEDA